MNLMSCMSGGAGSPPIISILHRASQIGIIGSSAAHRCGWRGCTCCPLVHSSTHSASCTPSAPQLLPWRVSPSQNALSGASRPSSSAPPTASCSSRMPLRRRMSCAFRTGKYGKNVWTGSSVKSQSGVVSKWPCRYRKEDGWIVWREKARWRDQRRMCKHLFHDTWAMRVCAHAWRCAKYAQSVCAPEKMCVRQASVCTHPAAHTVVATTCVRNPGKTLSRKKF